MQKKMCLRVIISLVVFVVALNINVFADEIPSEVDENNDNSSVVNKYEEFANYIYNESSVELTEEEKVTNLERANDTISELFDTLKDKLNNLDERVKYLRTTGEYDNYPAIRLNLDTPIFGLSSILEQKLKITKDVSPNDITDGYSIRSVVKNNYIKLPDSYIAGILISTYDVDLKTDIRLSNANLVILKLTQYINKVDEVEKFLDTQVSKFFRGYIDKEKLAGISDIESRISVKNQELLNISDSIIKLQLLGDNEKYNELSQKYVEYVKKLYDLKNKVSDTLMDTDTLNEYKKQMISLESDILNFKTDVAKNEVKNENITDEMMLQILKNTKEKISDIKDEIESYKTFSTYEKSVKITNDDVTVDTVEGNTENDTKKDQSSSEETGFSEQVKLYPVINTNVKSSLDNYESEIDVMIKAIEDKINSNSEEKEYEEDKNTENADEAKENLEENETTSYVLTDEELSIRNEMVSNVLRLYKEALAKQNKFTLSNVNNILKEVTSKISDLSKYTNADIYTHIKYVYIDIPALLLEYVNNSDSSCIFQENVISNLQRELDNMTKTYINISMIYQKMQVDELKQKD